jgi:long-chain acyl-CoA synthetase
MSLSSVLVEHASHIPDHPALVFHGRTETYGQLEDSVARTAGVLRGHGVEAGDRVALLLGNVPEFVHALYGTLRAGAVAVPLNVMLTAEEVGYILADSGAGAVVVQMGYLPTVLAVRDRLSDLRTVLVIAGPPVPPGTISFEKEMQNVDPAPEADRSPQDLAVLQYTSGTTARPKGAKLTQGALASNIEQMEAVETSRLKPDDIVLVVLPLFHIYGLNVVLGTAVHAGVTSVLTERFDPEETLELIERHKVTIVPGAPPMYSAWLRLSGERASAFESIRVALSGAAPLPTEVSLAFRERFGLAIWDSYGLTEAGPGVTTSAMGDAPRPGSIGRPLPGVEVRLVDEAGDDVEDGDPGEIVVKGPNVFSGYWGQEEESEAVLAPGGWLRTGDVAVRDEDGYLYLVDRKKDLIIVSGFNVYPAEVEEVLVRHRAVAEAGVIGIPDDRTGEAVKALVVLKEGEDASPEEITDFARTYLARFKLPKVVEIVSSLPKHATGKVLRRALRGEEMLGGGSPAADEPKVSEAGDATPAGR